jgi:hypothetical protein
MNKKKENLFTNQLIILFHQKSPKILLVIYKIIEIILNLNELSNIKLFSFKSKL